MNLNWLDIVLMAILLLTVILGLVKGLIKEVVGLASVILGLILACLYYPYVSSFFEHIIAHETLSHFLGFLIIFLAVLVVGGLISHLLSKLMKGPLKFLNHLLGGAFGFLKGILICAVIVFALVVFPISKEALTRSYFAPYFFGLAKAIVYLIPQDLRDQFKSAYKDLSMSVKKHGKKV